MKTAIATADNMTAKLNKAVSKKYTPVVLSMLMLKHE